MNGHKLALAFVLTLGACASTPPIVSDWANFAAEVDGLSPQELGTRISSVDEHYSTSPDDLTRLQLAYLLSRPGSEAHDVRAGRSLLEQIDDDGPYSALRDLVNRQITVEAELEASRQQVQQRNAQIELLHKQIDQLEEGLDRGTEQQAQLEALQSKVRELESQLEALKSIEAEMSQGQKAMDELPDE